MPITLTYDENPSSDDTKVLWEGISEHAKQVRDLDPGRAFAFFIKDDARQIKGGCSGYMYYGCLYIDLLWVDESLRNQGYGKQLMQQAENLAKECKCRFLTVNTMDFEALDFYKKLGFIVEFMLDDFDKHSIFYFLRKKIS